MHDHHAVWPHLFAQGRERAEESGDTAIQSVALSTGLGASVKLLHTHGNNFVIKMAECMTAKPAIDEAINGG